MARALHGARDMRWSIVTVLSLCACSDPSPSAPHRWADSGVDVPPDVPPGETGLFGACGSDHECLAKPGAVCLTTYPGGLCSFRCDDDGDCASMRAPGRCIANVCLPDCFHDPARCTAIGGSCFLSDERSNRTAYCIPSCYAASRVPSGEHACVSGTTCDEWANACVETPRTTGGDDGDRCRDGEECRGGICLLAADGYPDGYCTSYARMPEARAFAKGTPLPRSTCPAGSVIVPSDATAGEAVLCQRTCTTNADCRAGYECFSLDVLGYPTSICSPMDCTSKPCPTGYRCATSSRGGASCVAG